MEHELRDESGKLLGYFVTEAEYKRWQYELAKAESARREAEDAVKGVVRKWDGTNGMTTADVLALYRRLDEQAGGAR